MILPGSAARKCADDFDQRKFNVRVFSVASNRWFGAPSNIRICGESFRPRHIETTIATNSRLRKCLGIGVAESAAIAHKSDAFVERPRASWHQDSSLTGPGKDSISAVVELDAPAQQKAVSAYAQNRDCGRWVNHGSATAFPHNTQIYAIASDHAREQKARRF